MDVDDLGTKKLLGGRLPVLLVEESTLTSKSPIVAVGLDLHVVLR